MADYISPDLMPSLARVFFSTDPKPANLYLRLYRDGAAMAPGTSLAALAPFEQAGTGYSPKTLTPAAWSVTTSGADTTATVATQDWTTGANDWNDLRWAAITTSADNSGEVLYAKDHGPGVTVTGTGAPVTVIGLGVTFGP